jgi:hypothetical protein
MFNASYFRDMLQRDVQASGSSPVVELFLISGHSYRVRTVLDVGDDWLTVEAYLVKGDLAHLRPRFGGTDGEPYEIFRAVVSYESIVSVVFDPAPVQARTRAGFATG